MGKIAVEEKTTTTQKEKNKQAIQNINKSGTVSGKSSGVTGSKNVVTTNVDTSNLAGNNRQQALGTPKMTSSSKTNVLGKASAQEKGKTFVPETKTTNTSTTIPSLKKYQSTLSSMADESTRRANNVVNGITNAYNSFMENLGSPTKRQQQRDEYKLQRNQQKLDQVNKENMDLASQTRNEDIPRMFNADGSRIDYTNQKNDLQNQIAQLDSYINDIADETVTAAEISRRNELQQQLDEFDLLEKKAQAIEELNAQEVLRGDELSSYQEMLSHKNDNIFERFGNVMNHLGNTTTNIVPTAFDQMKELGTNAYAKENIEELTRLHEMGEIDDDLYKEALSEWQDYIDRHKSTNSDNLSQIIRANADQLSANTYYGANEIEKFCLQAGESTAQFLLHYVLLGEAATVSMSLASGTDRMNQLLMEGVDPQIAAQNGFMTGLVSYATEKIGMDRFVNMMGTPFSADALGSIIISQLKSGLSEGLEELVEGLVDPVIDSVTLGVPYTVDGNELKMEFLLGGASGLAMAIGGTALGTVKAGIEVNSILNERREIRADVQERISNLVVESQYQKNLLINEINMFKKHLNSMTETQRQVATELIAKGENAIRNYESMSQVQGVLFSSDIPYETTTEENDKAIYQTYTPNFNQEVQFEQKVNETENLINGLLDEQLALEGITNETQNILNESGYDIDSKVFNSLSPDQQNKALVALDFAKIMGMNVQVVNNLPSGQNGFVDPNTGNIVIDGTKRSILSTLSHELTHGTESSKYYSLLKDLAMANLEGDWNDIVNQKIEDYAKGNIQLDFENAEKEVVARYVEDKLGDENFIDNLVRYNFNLASKIYQDLKAMGSDGEIDKVRNAFEKAFADNYEQTAQKYSIAFNPSETDVDNRGNEIFEKMKERIKGTKLTDDRGRPLILFHTSPSLFTHFDPTKSSFYRFGDKEVDYFSTDPDVSGSYTNGDFVQIKNEQDYKNVEEAESKIKEIDKRIDEETDKVEEYKEKRYYDIRQLVYEEPFNNELKTLKEKVVGFEDEPHLESDNFMEQWANKIARDSLIEWLDRFMHGDKTYRFKYFAEDVQKIVEEKKAFSNDIPEELAEMFVPFYESDAFNEIRKIQFDINEKEFAYQNKITQLDDEKRELYKYAARGKQYVGYGKSLNPYILNNGSGVTNWNELNNTDFRIDNDTYVRIVRDIVTALDRIPLDKFDYFTSTKNRINRTILSNVDNETRDYLVENPIVLANFSKEAHNRLQGDMAPISGPGLAQAMMSWTDDYALEETERDLSDLPVYKFKGRLETNDIVTAVLAINDYIDNPYDGVVFKNITDSGSYEMSDIPSDIVALFKSNQFKFIENENPTDSPDFQYSYDPEEIKEIARESNWDEFHRVSDKGIIDSLKENGIKSLKSMREFWVNQKMDSFAPNDAYEISKEDAINVIRENIPTNILDGWFRNADSSYKEKLETLILENDELRNAGLNLAYDNYKTVIDGSISFDEFLNNELTLYRGVKGQTTTDKDVFLAYTYDEKTAKYFGNNVKAISIKPIDTLGSYTTSAETEILVPTGKTEFNVGDAQYSYDSEEEQDSKYYPYGMNNARETDILKETEQGRTRRHANNMANSGWVSDEESERIAQDVRDGEYAYQPVVMKQVDEQAKKTLKDMGFKKAYKESINTKEITLERIALARQVLNQMRIDGKEGTPEYEKLNRINAKFYTGPAQILAYAKYLRQSTPDGQIITIESEVERMQEELTKRWGEKAPELTIPQNLRDEYINPKTSEERRQEIREEIAQQVADKIPPTILEQLNSWRHLAMLFNPRTWIKNNLSNTAFGYINEATRGVRQVLEAVARNYGETHENSIFHGMEREAGNYNPFSKKDREQYKVFEQDYLDNYKKNISKYSNMDIGEMLSSSEFGDLVQEKRKQFNNGILNAFAEINAGEGKGVLKYLGLSDTPAMKKAYAKAMVGYFKVNNLDISNITEEEMQKAREFAYHEALYATFNTNNWLANQITKFERNADKAGYGSEARMIVESFIPFKRTPLNLIRTGYNYTPVGMATNLYRDLKLVKRGDMSANQLINHMAQGLTGTSLIALGMLLSHLGLFRTKDDDENRKKYFDKDNGEQDYALVFDGATYTIDWLDPMIVPIAMGAEIQKWVESGDISLQNGINIAASVADPIFETSMLSGISKNLKGYETGAKYYGQIAKNALSNYLSQYVPSIGGAITRTFDPMRRVTTPNKGDADYFLRSNRAKLGFSYLNEPYVNKSGEAEKAEDLGKDIFGRAILNFLSPGYYSSKDIDQYDEELYRLYDETGDIDALPSGTTDSFKYNKQTYDLSPEQYTQWHQTRWKTEAKYVNEFIDSDDYKNLTDDERVATIKKIRSYAQDVAKKQFLDEQGINYESKTLEKVNGALESGMDAYQYFDYESNAGTKQTEKMEYLENSNLTEKEKKYLWEQEGYKTSYEDVYKKVFGKGNSKSTGKSSKKKSNSTSKKKKSSTKAKNVSSSLKGGGSATKIRTNRATPIKGNTNFKKAYQNVFSQSRQGSKNVSSGSSGGGVCPNCGARVSANASRCPNCGAKL